MSRLTYTEVVDVQSKPLVWLHGEVKTPPFSTDARLEAGYLLRRLQMGEGLSLPHSRPMPSVGERCHELRLVDRRTQWRIIYRSGAEAIVILAVFKKQTQKTPKEQLEAAKQRLARYLAARDGAQRRPPG